MVRLLRTFSLVVALVGGPAARADWYFDFDDGVLPDDLLVQDNYYDGEVSSPTFEAVVEDGYLLLSDPVARGVGGSVRASAQDQDPEVFTDVRVTAVINPSGDVPCVFQGVSTRREMPGSAYYAAVVNAPGYGNSGNFAIGKNAESFMLEATDVGYSRLTDFSIPYRIELDVLTEHDSESDEDFAVVTGRLFDATTNALIYEMGFEDFSLAGRPPLLSGDSAAFVIDTWSSTGLAAAFDEISSVSLLLPGDYNRNRTLDGADLDLQADAIFLGKDPPAFDLTGDGFVDPQDRSFWIHELFDTWYGDADLNGQFDSQDFIDVFIAGKYETGARATWGEGDWDGNTVFDSWDVIAAFIDGGYESAHRARMASVPEPSAALLALIGGISCYAFRRCLAVAGRSSRLAGLPSSRIMAGKFTDPYPR